MFRTNKFSCLKGINTFPKIKPETVLSKDCVDIFYETIHDFERKNKSKVNNLEWNELIFKIRQLDEQFVYVS